MLGAALSGIATGGGLANMILGFWPPLALSFQQIAHKSRPMMIPTIGDLIEMRYRDTITESAYKETCRANGFDENYAELYYKASEHLLSVADYIALWRRGYITEEALERNLTALHLSGLEQEYAKTVTQYFPLPQDLVRFAVREVYTPAIVEKFGQMEDLPDKFIEEAKKGGLDEEQAKNFWGAHWDLPSPMQGFEMLHRRVIDEDTLKMLLKALDVMPFWRDALVAISYNPLTRVDVRRMHATGVLSEDEVFNAYLDVGFNEENAQRMLDFTIEYNSGDSSEITRSNIISAYKKGIIDGGELRNYLSDFFENEDVIEFWVDMAEYERAVSEIESDKNDLIERYRRGALTIDQVRSALESKNLPTSYIGATITRELSQPSKKLKMPTKVDLLDWLEKNIITDVEYSSSMSAIGYRSQDIQRYLMEYAIDVDLTKRRYLTIAKYQRWYGVGIMNRDEFIQTALEMDYSDEDINLLTMEVEEQINVAT